MSLARIPGNFIGGTKAVVYCCWAANGSLLYVGHTSDPRNRTSNHRAVRPWWPDVAEITVSPPLHWKTAAAHERALIRHLEPRHNVRGCSDAARRSEVAA